MKLLSICTFLFLCATFVNCSNSSDEDENEVSDTEDIIENNDLPEHEFVTEEKTVKSGKNKGQKKYRLEVLVFLLSMDVKNWDIEFRQVALRCLKIPMVNVNMNLQEFQTVIDVCQVQPPISRKSLQKLSIMK